MMKTDETELSQINDVTGGLRFSMLLAMCDDGPSPLVPPLILDGRQEVEEQLVPQPGLVQVGGVTRPRQDLGLGGAGQQSQVISRPEYGEESKNTCLDIALKRSFI